MPGQIVKNFRGVFLVRLYLNEYALFFHFPSVFKTYVMTSLSLTIPERISDKSYAQVVGKANILLAEIGWVSESGEIPVNIYGAR